VPPACPLVHQDTTHLTALDLQAQLVRGLLLVVGGQRPVGLPSEPAGRVLADQVDQLATLDLAQPTGPAWAGPITEPVHTVLAEAVQPLPHGLGVAA
jgi:hypothetical protein